MKKIFLSAALLLSGVSFASTAEVTWTSSKQGYSNAQEISNVAVDANVNLTFDKGTNSNVPKYYNTGTAIRLYGGNTMTLTGDNATITKVEIITQSSNPVNDASTVTVGSLDITTTQTTWTGEASEFTFTQGGDSGHARIQSIAITYEVQRTAPSVKKPSINANGGKEFFDYTEILIEAEEGTSIYYTTNKNLGNAKPIDVSKWNKYTSTFEVSESCVVYAVAKKDSDISEVAFITLTKNPTMATLADLPEATETGVDICVIGPVVVVGNFTSKGYLYVKDLNSDVSMRLYDQTKKTPAYQPGEKLSNIKFVYSLYNATPQGAIAFYLNDYPTPTTEEIPAADVPQPVVTTEWGALNVYAKFENVQPYKNGSNTYFDLGEDKIQIYAGLGIAMTIFEEGCYYDVLGYTLNYKETKEIYFAGASQSITPQPVISFTKNEGITFTDFDNAALAEDVKVYYTILSEKDLVESVLETLTDPAVGAEGTIEWDGNVIATDNATAIKAIAVKTGYAASEVAKFYVAQENATGVAMLEAADTDVEIYDLNGRRINGNTLEKGIYIMRTAGKAVKFIR